MSLDRSNTRSVVSLWFRGDCTVGCSISRKRRYWIRNTFAISESPEVPMGKWVFRMSEDQSRYRSRHLDCSPISLCEIDPPHRLQPHIVLFASEIPDISCPQPKLCTSEGLLNINLAAVSLETRITSRFSSTKS